MSRITNYAAAALCAVPALAMIQPAQAGAKESHELAMQYIEMTDIVSDKIEQLKDSMGESFAEFAAIELASVYIMRSQILHELSQESGLTDADIDKMKAKVAANEKRDSANIAAIMQTEVEDMPLTVKAALMILNVGTEPTDAEEIELVSMSCVALILTDFEVTGILLQSIKDAQSAKDVVKIIDLLDTHASVLVKYLRKIDPDKYDELSEIASEEIQTILSTLKSLKKAKYYGNATLREYGERKLD